MKKYKELQKEIKEILKNYKLSYTKKMGMYNLKGEHFFYYKDTKTKNLKDLKEYLKNQDLNKLNILLNADEKIYNFLNWVKNKANVLLSFKNSNFTINNISIDIKDNNINQFFDYVIDTDLFLYQKSKMGLNYYHVDYLIKNNQLYNEDVKELFNLIELYKLNQKLENKLIKKNVATKTIKI